MRAQIEISAVGDAHQLVPLPLIVFAFREEAVLNINGPLGVVGQLFFWLLIEPQVVGRHSEST